MTSPIPTPNPTPPSTLQSTLRLQFHKDYTFADALQSIDYFAALGVSHLYASPITTSQPGSTHGYDTVDYTRVNAALGGEDGLRQLVAALRTKGMGLIIDIVPNHMGVGGADNAWWRDILEWGRHAAHARYFDIDWHSPDPALRGKVLAPFLGESFGDALAGEKIVLHFDAADGRFYADYYSHRFPICPTDYPRILESAAAPELRRLSEQFERLGNAPEDQAQAEQSRHALRDFAASDSGRKAVDAALEAFAAGTPTGREALQRLLDHQHYRLSSWRAAADEVNWRRFFDISALAGMRVERAEVFDASHALVLRLYAEGLIDGVRIDHVDGLAEPREYCQRLAARLVAAHAQRPAALRAMPPYLVVEKILARGEAMRTDWQIDGTTGYDFMNDVGALLHDANGAAPLAQTWAEVSGRSPRFSDEALPARRKVLAENLSAELDRTARALHRIARDNPSTRDYSFTAIRRVLTELAVHYPVYRIYPVELTRSVEDEKYFSVARDGARAALRPADHALLDQIDEWLGAPAKHGAKPGKPGAGNAVTPDDDAAGEDGLESAPDKTPRDPRIAQRRIALTLFSQLTSPVAAKSVEDTACYRYGRLISRNEVGADPDDFALSVPAFHAINADRAAHFPHAMLTTATHDHKRGEDVRARIAALSELPAQWAATLHRWSAMNAPAADGGPGPGFESMLYQTLLGCWPADLSADDAEAIAALAERVAAWQEKALREAKLDTDWFAPNEPYEKACRSFLNAILAPQARAGFLQALSDFVRALAPLGVINSLQQTLLRLTSPGIPDLYQGTELWDMTLVDPDNRRPVDYPLRARLLEQATALPAAQMLTHWQDGQIKQTVIHRALLLRQRVPALFLEGDYLPLEVTGTHAGSVLAFARRHGPHWAITVVTRLAARLLGTDKQIDALGDGASVAATLPRVDAAAWGDTRLVLPAALQATALFDHLGQVQHRLQRAAGNQATLEIGAVLAALPVALLSTVEA
ncbi:malto-oligosyltrehalose synthase [Robbsia sp. Bb-Pol-6]|uniref:Malto-oligosyltrehalose synthase n=1 Tax=Robbsia betulipollinis TaxID=2981849 RepID=A0ABT3ZIU4_9BURK|nr:malto-oligosyltrehalose synthase [Robbsia betulipollinis]MCY0386436.1 malto-oligosyltrehalose synthase [Robbsia betulipollinis]